MAEQISKKAKAITQDSELKPGMTVRIHQKIKELNSKGEEKERIQYFEGMIIARRHGGEKGATITVRKTSDGIGVEKIFPLALPTITKVEIKNMNSYRTIQKALEAEKARKKERGPCWLILRRQG